MMRMGLIVLVACLAISVVAPVQPAQLGSTGEKKGPIVLMVTTLGPITIELFDDQAPLTVKNFLRYVEEKHYDGTIFHRVISDFMIQGGGFDFNFKEKGTYAPIKNEAGNGISNKRGTIAMARTNNPDSATAQFYINVKDNPGLDRAKAKDKFGYTVFGQVIDGMEVVDKIKRVDTGDRAGHDDVPLENVIIRSVRRVDKK